MVFIVHSGNFLELVDTPFYVPFFNNVFEHGSWLYIHSIDISCVLVFSFIYKEERDEALGCSTVYGYPRV